MTRTIRRAAIAATLLAASIVTGAAPALAADAPRAAAASVVSAGPSFHQAQVNGSADRWKPRPTARPTRTVSPVATRPPVTPTAAPSNSASVPTAAPVVLSDYEAAVVTLTNAERTAKGCAVLRADSRLVVAARAHSNDMVTKNFFSHTGSDGSDFVTREARAGYTTGASAENIAWGYRTPKEVVTGWMNSAGHRANILNCSSVAVGVGLALTSNGSAYWTQDFGRI